MNIFKIDFEKLQKYITEYILKNNNTITCNIDTVKVNKPIIFMNSETLKVILNNKTAYLYPTLVKKTLSLWGCYIVKAEWLDFGEIKLGEINNEI